MVAFESANLTGAKIEGADLRECAIMDDKTNEVGRAIASTFRGATLRGTNLRGARLADADLRGADFTDCKKGQLPGTALMTLLQQAV